jgi:tetratricopeptide (TPR) repeat protein
MRSSFSFLGMFLLLAVPPSFSQVTRLERGGQIRGQVRLPDGSTAPQGAMVTLESAALGQLANAQTDSQGKFFIQLQSLGVYVLRVRHVGYEEATERIDLTMSPTAFVEVRLKPIAGSAVAPPSGVINASTLAVPEAARKEFDKGKKQLFEEKKPDRSLSSFRKAIEIHPSFAEAHLMLGTAHMQLQQWKEAQPALEKAVELDEKQAAAHLALGICLAQQNNHAAAEAALKRGLELNPGSPEGHLELGKVYWALGRWQEAEPHARKALELKPDVPFAHVLMGNILLRKRDAKGALAEFNTYLKMEPNGPFALGAKEMVARIGKALGSEGGKKQ